MSILDSFFSHPIERPLKDLLFERAKQRYIDEGNSLPEDMNLWSKEAKRLIDGYTNDFFFEELKKLKSAKKVFNQIISNLLIEALKVTFSETQPTWYAKEEVKFSDFPLIPNVLTVPMDAIRHKLKEPLFILLSSDNAPIEIKNFLPETRLALSVRSIEMVFDEVVKRMRNDTISFEINKLFAPVIIVDIIKKDFYYMDNLDYVSRLNMLVISEYYFNKSGTERENEKRKKKILRNWQIWKNRNNRSNNRRFISEPWNLPKGIIQMEKA